MATELCSLRCAHCLVGPLGGGATLTLAEVQKMLDQVAALGIPQLLVTGGEPLERPDLPEVVALLGERRIRWSLNTARLPDAACRAALRAYPPAFVAVSLDGPERHHDRHRGFVGAHREALEAIDWFRRIVPGGQVAAGTTITRSTVRLLEETFGEVVASGASQWGLHVVFPEGRAASAPELLLDRRQLRRLMRFAAEKRAHFPITLGDEFGYLGSWEPLLREEPFFCGAGQTQCVILADGEVVPCTTTDRSVSAGNLRARSLEALWSQGFAELRRPPLTQRCRSCSYAAACGGGCWLQRRAGVHCYRDVWSRPRELATAAGMAVCLGLSACTGAATRGSQPSDPADQRPVARATSPKDGASTSRPTRHAPARRATATQPGHTAKPGKPARIDGNDALEMLLLRWMRTQLQHSKSSSVTPLKRQVKQLLGKDPAGSYLLSRLSANQPSGLSQRLGAIRAALKTRQRSLSFAALLARDLAEWCLDQTPAAKRTPADRKAIRQTLQALERHSQQWRQDVFAHKLSPFLTRNYGVSRPFVLLKSLRVRIADPALAMVAAKRYQLPPLRRQHIAAAFLKGRPVARSMRLRFTVASGQTLTRVTAMGKTQIRGNGHLDVLHVLRVPSNGAAITVHVAGKTLRVTLPAACEVTWADVLRLTDEQHHTVLRPWARSWLTRGSNLALQIPALRAWLASPPAANLTAQQRDTLRWRLLHAWMF